MNDSLYNYLLKASGQGGKVTVLENGTYFVEAKTWKMYLNPALEKDVNLVVYYPGAGGARDVHTTGLRDHMTSANPANYVSIISRMRDDDANALELATKILNDNGYSIKNLVTTSNSYTGGIGISRTANYLVKHPELCDSTVIVSNDGYNLGQIGKNYQVLVDNKVPIVLLAPNHDVKARLSDRVRKFTESFTEKGLNVYQMETRDADHGTICKYSYINGVPEYILGLQDELGNEGDRRAPEYVLLKYNPQTNQYEKADMEDIRIVASFKDVVNNLVDPNTYKSITYNLDTSLGVGKTTNLASDMSSVMESMNNLSSIVKNTSFAKTTNNGSSNSLIPALFYDSQNYLLGVSSTLSDNLGKESAVIANIAQAIYNMDVNLSQRTNGLNDPVNAQRINSTLNEIFSTDIRIPYTSFISPLLLNKVTQGKTGKICLSDLKAMLSGGKLTGSIANAFDSDNADTKKAIDSIKSFQEKISSNVLQGDIWNLVNSKLDVYSSLLNKRISSNDKLKEAIEEAIKLIEEYMGDFEELDDSILDELKDKVNKLESEIDELQSKINSIQAAINESKESGEESTVANVGSISKFKKSITDNKELIEEFKKQITKLEGLWEVINKAADIINAAIEEIKSDYVKGVQDLAVAEPEKVLDSTSTPVISTNASLGSSANTSSYPSSSYNSSSGGYRSSGGSSSAPKAIKQTTPQATTAKPNMVIDTNVPTVKVETPEVQSNEPVKVNNVHFDKAPSGYVESEQPEIVEIEEPVVEEPVIEASIAKEPIMEEVVVEDLTNQEILKPQEIAVNPEPQVIEVATKKPNSTLKTVGVLAGVGLATGAAAYAAGEMKKAKMESDEDDDFGYDSSNDSYY